MKRAYVICPAIATIAFSGYFWCWQNAAPERENERRLAKIESIYHLAQFNTRDGAKEALADIQSGELTLKSAGCIVGPWTAEKESICEERFGLKIERLAGPFTSESLNRYISSYNQVMWEHLTRNYHVTQDDITTEAHERFRKKHQNEANHPAEQLSSSLGGPS